MRFKVAIKSPLGMSIFRRLFAPPERKVLAIMDPFTRAALLLVPRDRYENDEVHKKRVLVFLFGALDALIQAERITGDAMSETLSLYLMLAFPTMSESEVKNTVNFLADASADPAWIPIMQRGGQTMVDWSRGDSTAPARLVKIVQHGLDDF